MRFSLFILVWISILSTSFHLNAQLSLTFNEDFLVEIDGRNGDLRPEILMSNENYIITNWSRFVTWKGLMNHIVKIRLSDGELEFSTRLEEAKYKNLSLIFEEAYWHDGTSHMLYRTSRRDNDSLHLIDFEVDSTGNLSAPHVLNSGWVEDDRNHRSLMFSWNEDQSRLGAITVLKTPETGQAKLIRRTFDRAMNLMSSDTFNLNASYDSFSMAAMSELLEASYLLGVFEHEMGTAAQCMELTSNGIRTINASMAHGASRNYGFHANGDRVQFSYLSYQDDRYKRLSGYHSVDLNFGERLGWSWATSVNFTEEFRNMIANSDRGLLRDTHGWISIKNFIPHPSGGYIVILDRKYAKYESNSDVTTYYDLEYIVSYIDSNDVEQWTRFIPVATTSINKNNSNPMIGFTPNQSLVVFTATEPGLAQEWTEGNIRSSYPNFLGYLACNSIAAVTINLNGDMSYQELYDGGSSIYAMMPTVTNMSRIQGTDHAYYIMKYKAHGNDEVYRINVEGLVPNSGETVFKTAHYGYQE